MSTKKVNVKREARRQLIKNTWADFMRYLDEKKHLLTAELARVERSTYDYSRKEREVRKLIFKASDSTGSTIEYHLTIMTDEGIPEG